MGQKYRAQILLEQDQHRALRQIAEEEGRSVSEVARELIQTGLEARQLDTEELWKRRDEAIQKLNEIREAGAKRYGVYHGDLVNEARAERDQQMDEVMGFTQKP